MRQVLSLAELRRGWGIPFAVGLTTLAAFVVLNILQRDLQKERFAAEVELVSSNFAARLETHLEARLHAGALLGATVTQYDGDDAARFRSDATVLHELFGDFQALNLVDAEGVIQLVTPQVGNEAALGLDLTTLPLPAATLARVDETGRLQVTPPLTLAQGGKGFVAYVPIFEEGRTRGYVNVVFRAAPLIRNALGEEPEPAYAYRVVDGEDVLFETTSDVSWSEMFGESRITVGDRMWQLKVAPTPARIQAASSFVDEALLVVGVILALITGSLARLVVDRQTSLEDSRKRFAEFVDASSDWYWEMDQDLRLTWCSDGIEDFFDLPKEQFIGRRRGDFRDPANDDEAWAMHHADLDARRPFRDFFYAIRVRGARRWVRVSGSPRFDRMGRFIGYRGTASDATETVASRNAVERANARLADAVERLEVIFSLWDSDDRLVFGNRAFREINKSIPNRIVPGTPFEDYLRAGVRHGHMPFSDMDEDSFVAMSVERRFDPTSEPFEITRADGTVLRLHEQLLEGGGIVTIATDVTRQRKNEAALRESEERLALAVRQLTIWDWNLDTGALYMSPGFAENLGYSAAEFEDITSGSVADIIHPDDAEGYRAKLEAHLNDPTGVFTNEHRFRTKSGDYKWYLAIGQAMVNEDGRVVRSAGVLTEITDRVELEQRLHQAHKMEAIGNLTGGIAHDFNNLLAVILGNFELIREADDPDKLPRYIEAGMKATRRGADLIKNMLSFARKSRLEPAPLDLNDLVAETQDWFGRILPENISLEAGLSADVWTIVVDPNHAQTALLNLILNARDAMADGGSLTIETENLRVEDDFIDEEGALIAPGPYVMLAVSDTGCGIPKSQLATVFEPFFTTKPPGAGSGLGLSMVQGFMKQSGGFVRVYSEVGTGTTFKLFFPAVRVNEKSVDAALPLKNVQISRDARIFLVEDEPAVLSVLSETLRNAGYQIHSATSGDAALAVWEEGPSFDLLITDIVMPGQLQGTHLAKALRERHPDLPVVFMSGYAREATVHGNGLRNEDIRLMKPVSKADLIAAVEKALKGAAFDDSV